MNSIGSDTKYSYMMLMKSTNTLKDRISRIDDIAKAESGILNLCKMLFIESDKKNKDDVNAKNFYVAKNRYIEMKERNNLIKHRGFTYDEKYIKNIEQTLDQKSSINDLLKSLGVIKKDARKELIGKNVITSPQYFKNAASNIIFLASYFIYNVCNTDEERETFLNNVIHGLLKVSYELSSLPLITMSRVLISLFGEFENQPEVIQFNYILTLSRRNDYRNKYFKKPRNEKEREIKEKINNRYKVFVDETPKKMKLDDAYKKLVSYYLKNKTEDFLNQCFSMDKIKSEHFQNWAIFQKYHKNKSFLSRFKSKYKTDFKPTKDYV